MKNLFLLGLVGLLSFGSAVEAQAGRRCGGHHHRRGCGGCYSMCQPTIGCQVYAGVPLGMPTDPNTTAPAAGAAVNPNAPPAEPEPVR